MEILHRIQNLFLSLLTTSLAILIAAPAAAHPPSLRGINLPSVVSVRDQARVIAHLHHTETHSNSHLPQLQNIRTIVLDPGHGGENNGAIGVTHTAEKYLTLELAYELRERLQQKYPDLRVILTRYWDTSVELTDRVHLANMAEADIFISLHYNAAVHDRAIGFETYFLRPEEVTPGQEELQSAPLATVSDSITGIERPVPTDTLLGQHNDTITLIQQDLLRSHQHLLSGRLAEVVQDRFRHHLDSIDRGVKQANFSVLRGAHMPAVVVEAGFLTHPDEGFELTQTHHRHDVSTSILEAIEAFDSELSTAIPHD